MQVGLRIFFTVAFSSSLRSSDRNYGADFTGVFLQQLLLGVVLFLRKGGSPQIHGDNPA
jgi:hypothetical protein